MRRVQIDCARPEIAISSVRLLRLQNLAWMLKHEGQARVGDLGKEPCGGRKDRRKSGAIDPPRPAHLGGGLGRHCRISYDTYRRDIQSESRRGQTR